MTFFVRLACIAACALISAQSFCQQPGFNSGDVIKAGAEFYNQEKYKEAAAEYLKIPRNDTNYQTVLHDLALIYYADSNYAASKEAAMRGLKFYPQKADDWYNLIANTLDKQGDQAQAVAYYDSIISKYQYAYLPWFNKGISYYNANKMADAKRCLQQSVLINPFYTPAHFQLGVIALEEGDLISAILSFTTNLLINPENKYAGNSVRNLNNISRMTDEVTKVAAKSKALPAGFEMLQEIVSSKLALDPKYKLKASLEDPIVRQLQVVLEKLAYNKNEQNFSMQYYVPFYTQLNASPYFEPFINRIFSGLDVKEVKSYVKKNEKLINAFLPMATNYFNEIKQTEVLNVEARKTQEIKYLFSDGELTGRGKIVGEGDNAVLSGDWELYFENGALQSKGAFNEKREKTGVWHFYHANGKLKERTTYINNKPEGKTVSWFDNGQLAGEYQYKDGELNGLVTENYYNGLLKRVCTYKADKKEGTEKGYGPNGVLRYTAEYIDGTEEGVLTYYHPNGKVSSASTYKAGKADGGFKTYYLNGSLKMEGAFAADKRVGEWKEYFNNGKQKAVYSYVDGEMSGPYATFYANGKPMIQSMYVKDKLDGKYEDFDIDGKLYSSSVYEKGRLKELKFFDKSNNLVSNASIRNGGGNLVYYNEEGTKTSEGYFTKEGLRNGKTTWYYSSGKISSEATYKDGLLQGEKVNYYKNGNVASRINYKDDEEDGYKQLYYINGNKQYEGLMVEGEADGTHIQYNEMGQVISKVNYRDNEVEGFTEFFHPNGKPDFEQQYSSGWLTGITQFDTLGKTLMHIDLEKGNGAYQLRKYNGGKFVESAYQHHYLNGSHKIFFSDKYPSFVQNYRYGVLDSAVKVYYYGGQVHYEGQYKMGERDGKWNFYYENGKLYYTETYDNGRLNGPTKLFNDDGMLDKEITYSEGEIDGTYKMYGEGGALAMILNYEEGKIVSYTYEGRDGKLVPAIPVKNGKASVVAYFKNGVKSAEFTIEDWDVNGARKLYFLTGKLYVDGTRVWGYDHGVKKVYLPDGTLQKEQNFYYDKLHGIVKTYHPNGKLSAEENWYNGELHGPSKYYDTTGKLTETRNYYYSSLQSVNK